MCAALSKAPLVLGPTMARASRPMVQVAGTIIANAPGIARKVGPRLGIAATVAVGVWGAYKLCTEVRSCREIALLTNECNDTEESIMGTTVEQEEARVFNENLSEEDVASPATNPSEAARAAATEKLSRRKDPRLWTRKRITSGRIPPSRRSSAVSLIRDSIRAELGYLPARSVVNRLLVARLAAKYLKQRPDVRATDAARMIPLIVEAVFVPYEEDILASRIGNSLWARLQRWRAGGGLDIPK
ncbi:ORF1a putative 25K replicase component [Arracacha latent virus E associated RNA]|nr:ORF1a putative 25K replicase component [Arracacha latent virus E associated RNA]